MIALAIMTQAIAFDYHSDSLAVRSILDANKLNKISVAAVTKNTVGHESDTPRVFELHLDSMGIDTIPDQIENLSKLNLLYVNGNKLRALPKTIANLKNLYHIEVSNNELKELPAEMALINYGMNSSYGPAISLLASNNKIASIPDSIPNIGGINLSGNLLTQIPDKWFGRAYSGLNLSNNLITSVPQKIWQTSPLNPDMPIHYAADFSGNLLKTIPDGCDSSNNMRFNFANNALVTLPASIVKLHHEVCVCNAVTPQQQIACMTYMSSCTDDYKKFINFSGNKLCNLSTDLMAWLDTSAGDWRSSQICGNVVQSSLKSLHPQIQCVFTASGFSIRSLRKSKNLIAEVFDFRGRLVMSQKVEGNIFETSNMKSGVYLLSVKENGQMLFKARLFTAR
jgi:Leucine-rich repeat (LRR) protein